MANLKLPVLVPTAALLLLPFIVLGCSGRQGDPIFPAPAPAAPNGTIVTPASNVVIAPGQSVTFSATAADPDGEPVTVLWDFGDGSTSTLMNPGAHTFAVAGTYTVTLTATDSLGTADPTPDTQTVTVQTTPVNGAPNATIDTPGSNLTITPGQAVAFAGTATDPDSDPVTVSWDFGDGTANSALLTPGNHSYALAGTYTVTFAATDSLGLADPTPATRTITVQTTPVNNPPNGTIAAPAANTTITVGQSVTFTGTAADPDGNNPVTVLWNFGDGTTSTLLAPGSHTYSTLGTFTVTLTATDSLGLADSSPATRTITVQAVPVNSAPNGTITAPAANTTITAGQSVAFNGTAIDPEGNPMTVLWNFGDGSATSTLLTPGNHTYALAGTYTVTFTAKDSLGLADPTPATRTITVSPVSAAATLTQVQSTVFASCTGCHSAGGSAGLNLTAGNSFSNLVNVPARGLPGLRVVPNSPSTSALVTQLANGHRNVSAANQALIVSWINGGALNN